MDRLLKQGSLTRISIIKISILTIVMANVGCMSSESVKSRLNLKSESTQTSEDTSLLPKYGLRPKNSAQKRADEKFLKSMDDYFDGDRKKAAEVAASRGWKSLRQGDSSTAMRRFNQAWMLDKANGTALWGMAAIEGGKAKVEQSLALFSEAETYIGSDIDFEVDYARAIGLAGVKTKNKELIKEAFTRYAKLYKKFPQHTLNIQNWAHIHFYIGNYSEAWEKIELAELTPRHSEMDQDFISKLAEKMPRP